MSDWRDDDDFESFVAGGELETKLDDPDWIPTEEQLRTYRAFGAPKSLLRDAESRYEEQFT